MRLSRAGLLLAAVEVLAQGGCLALEAHFGFAMSRRVRRGMRVGSWLFRRAHAAMQQQRRAESSDGGEGPADDLDDGPPTGHTKEHGDQ
jgi:hypothetical protein